MKKLIKILCLFWAVLYFFGALPYASAQAPNLSLKDSVPVAEKALADANIKAADYYLYSITFANSSKGSYWSYTFRSQTPSESNQVYVKVYMDKTTDIQGGTKKSY